MTGYVYAIRCGEFVKIGHSQSPENRRAKISADSPYEAKILGYWDGSLDDEIACHARFSHLHVRGEWFRDSAELRAFVDERALPMSERSPKIDHPLSAYIFKSDLTFDEFGKAVGLSRTSLHRIINGSQKPSADSALAIVEATSGAVRLEDLIRKAPLAAE